MTGQPDPSDPDRTPPALREFVARLNPGASGLAPVLDAALVVILEACEQRRLAPLLLKGAALAQLLYREDEQRGYADIDLLIDPRELDRVRQCLSELGYHDSSKSLGIDDVGGVVHAESWIDEAHVVQVELHYWLAGSQLDPHLAWQVLSRRRLWIEIAGRSVPVLDRGGQAMQLALHAAQHGPDYPKGLRELALGLERWPIEVWQDAAGLASELQAADTFAAGLRLVAAGERLARELGLASNPALDWEIRNRGARPRGTFHLDALSQASTARERLDILRRSLFPARAWLVWHYPWADRGRTGLALARTLHLLRAPAWALRALRFRRRAQQAGRPR